MLGFPAILPASLTLIQKREGKNEASIDSIGAILGATALIVVAVTATSWGVLPGLLTAMIVWLVVAVRLYIAIALVYEREFSAP